MGKESIQTEGCKLLMDAFQYIFESTDTIEIQTTESYSSSNLSRVNCNMYIYSRNEKENVALQTRPNNLIH
jgi:hypothetical protein